MKKKKIIIFCVYPYNGAPSQRFRFEQQLPLLEKHFNIQQFPFWSSKTNNLLYVKGQTLAKVLGVFKGNIKRFHHLIIAINADIIFIHREIIPFGSSFFENILKKIFRKKIIFDFDDAIWNIDTSPENKKYEWLKSSKKTSEIIYLSSCVIAGNKYLENFAKEFNDNTFVIPTTIDTNYHIPKTKKENAPICIGWTGSLTTVKHFEIITPVLLVLKKKYKDLITFKLIGDVNYKNEPLNLTGTPWRKETEIGDLQEIDIGIMPLPDDEWTKGKCGFKGLQYMALEIPTIMSPVGVNTEIISEGVNGYLAATELEWINKLSDLIESEALRIKIGKEARQTVIKRYSVEANKDKYLAIFNSI